MSDSEEKGLPTGRIVRLMRVGRLAAGLATDVAGAAGRLALGGDRDEVAEKFHRAAAAQLASALGRMKGLPMKVGQMLSYIDDFIPPEFRTLYGDALRALQTKAAPLRWAEVEAVIRADLKKGPDELFARFDREPIAAASIGQVYRAALKDGTEVAVKVQYPGIADSIRSDLKNIDVFKTAFSLVLPKVDVERSLSDISSRVLEECDYGCEICNQDDFSRAWEGDGSVVIPRVIAELSGERVLVTEFVSGMGWREMLERCDEARRAEYGRNMFRFVFRSLYVYGLFNADPHPGNYLFLPDGRVAFLDFGCVQRFDREAVEQFRHVRRLAQQGVRGTVFREAMRHAYGLPADLDEEQWLFLEEYLLCALEPALSDRPYRYDRAYTERLLEVSLRGGILGAKKAATYGIWEAKRPGLIFLNRLQYGFASILAAMDAEANWYSLIEEIEEEIARGYPKTATF